MLTRLRPRPILDLARRDLPGPLDVINLITPSRFDRYRWYGLLVMPVMSAVGGRVIWMGRFEDSISGERQAEKFLIVRYPSQRRFLAMTLNPYYLAINRFREAGVHRFEASFTHASHSDPGLSRRKVLVAVHFNSAEGDDLLPEVQAAGEVVGELVYATREVASVGLLDPPRDTDPNPLKFRQIALFAPSEDSLQEAGLAGLSERIAAIAGDSAIQVYRREPRSTYRPSFRPSPSGVEAAA